MPAHLLRYHSFVLVVLVALLNPVGVLADGVSGPRPVVQSSGGAIPEPPQQKAPWASPGSGVPDSFVSAAKFLFAQGMADPRGCEYREVTVPAGITKTLDTHGWVLPRHHGDPRTFAVGWNGLVCPVLSVGQSADLEADVLDQISPRKRALPAGLEMEAGSHRELDYRAVALLLRLGEGRLATLLWSALPPPWIHSDPENRDPYFPLAFYWTRSVFNQALAAHARGDDTLALHGFRRMAAVLERVKAEGRRRGFTPNEGWHRLFASFAEVPSLLADQERRARQGRQEPVICLGPGKDPNASRRIAALIARLEELASWLPRDPIFTALIQEGEATIEPLLDCLERDQRLTRCNNEMVINRPDCPTGFLPVSLVAWQLLDEQLAHAGFPALKSPAESNHAKRQKALIQTARAWWKLNRDVPLTERWLRILADDQAPEERWVQALSALVEIDGKCLAPATGSAPQAAPVQGGKKDPRVTALIVRRIRETTDVDIKRQLAVRLSKWDREAALPFLSDLMKQLGKGKEPSELLQLARARLEAGDRGALDDYAEWLRTVNPTLLNHPTGPAFFDLMAEHPNDTAVARSAEWLFHNLQSPWVPLLRNTTEDFPTEKVLKLIRPDMLRVAGFRSAVLRHLDDRTKAGKAEWGADGMVLLKLDGMREQIFSGTSGDLPSKAGEGEVRVCDCFAWLIGERCPAAPAFDLWQPVPKRDQAVKACAEFIRRYHGGEDFARLGQPATVEQAAQGRAIFSLQGEGRVRTVRLPNFPQDARWVTLRKRRAERIDSVSRETAIQERTTVYQQEGKVWQAEEVFKDGKWHRYYGFGGVGHMARIPAEEIEFPLSDPRGWLALDAFDLALNGPVGVAAVEEGETVRLPAKSAVRFQVRARHRKGTDQAPPSLEGIRLRVWHSPEVVSRQGMLVPAARRESGWSELQPRTQPAWKLTADRPLGPAEERVVAQVDLRDCFDVSRPGFYRVRFVAGDVSEEIRFSLAPAVNAP